jgi:hypothetical protein
VGAEVVEGVEPAVDQADAGFPLDAAAVDELLAGLQARLVALLRRRGRGQGELRAILG